MKNETVEITSERIDDIPVVVEWLKQMEIAKWGLLKKSENSI
jgi:hypothetical protein